jgi:hypothetical protein
MSHIPAILLSSSGLVFLAGFLIGLFANVPIDRRQAGDIAGVTLMWGFFCAFFAFVTVGTTQFFWASFLVAMLLIFGLSLGTSVKRNQAQ